MTKADCWKILAILDKDLIQYAQCIKETCKGCKDKCDLLPNL
jgi:hypothetical protein